jgi:hypothetical protein
MCRFVSISIFDLKELLCCNDVSIHKGGRVIVIKIFKQNFCIYVLNNENKLGEFGPL